MQVRLVASTRHDAWVFPPTGAAIKVSKVCRPQVPITTTQHKTVDQLSNTTTFTLPWQNSANIKLKTPDARGQTIGPTTGRPGVHHSGSTVGHRPSYGICSGLNLISTSTDIKFSGVSGFLFGPTKVGLYFPYLLWSTSSRAVSYGTCHFRVGCTVVQHVPNR